MKPLFDLPQALERNRNLWALQMMKALPVQRIISSFTNRVRTTPPLTPAYS